MKVVEIFKSIDGEGITVGYPAVFVRLYGCNLRCKYCDTPYGYSGDNYKDISIPEILQAVTFLKTKRVTVTGGEPLIHPNINILLSCLCEKGFKVNVETNGTVEPSYYHPNIIYTMDYKLPCSGMSKKMNIKALNSLREQDVLKFVVGSKQDMDEAVSVIKFLKSNPVIYFSPVFGSIEPKDIVEYILSRNINNVRVQLQLHKLIWEPERRGV
jgi:7-carboxy-7-deazaguanine synthase